MKYSLQKKLNEILEKLQNRVNEGYFNTDSQLKAEAIRVITIIRNEFAAEIEEYIIRTKQIEDNCANFDEKCTIDWSFGKEYFIFWAKRDIKAAYTQLLFFAKYFLADSGLPRHQEYLFYQNVFLQEIRQNDDYYVYLLRLTCDFEYYMHWGFDNDENFLIEGKSRTATEEFTRYYHSATKAHFENSLLDRIISNPTMLENVSFEDFNGRVDSLYDLKAINISNELLLDLILTDPNIIYYIHRERKKDMLINLFALYGSKKTKVFLHPDYASNRSFLTLFD
jgi:hypothetical protein